MMAYDTRHLDGLDEFCTVRQLEVLHAVRKHGGIRAAARALGRNKNAITQALTHAQRRAALQGHSPRHDMTRTVPDGFRVRGVSTYYDAEGKPRGQWVKSAADSAQQEAIMRAAFDALADELPRQAPIPAPTAASAELCNLIVLTDCHVGMLAWSEEGGADWNLPIAERTLLGAVDQVIERSPRARVCVVAQIGDWLHQDSIVPVTPTSGHVLDAAARFPEIVQASLRILRAAINRALQAHDEVVVLMGEGNHDITSSVWLRAMFRALYEAEPRVRVIDSALPYYAHQHGNTMLAFHHGHLRKNDQLPLTFAAGFPEMWGATRKRYCHTGHRHHVEEKEHAGMTVVQHPTIAARDAYAARGGWISERQITGITYHSAHGQVSRVTVTPEMLS